MATSTIRVFRNHHKNSFFSLTVDQGKEDADILMKLLIPAVNTKRFPATHLFLKKYLPSILRSRCFNPKNYPFSVEVRQTEIGHLFEHILLEYLCREKMIRGIANPIYNGVTEWNWSKDEKGTFHINIDIGYEDKSIVTPAVNKSISLLTNIIQSNPAIHKMIN